MTLRIGILGAADIGPKAVINPAKELPGVEVTAVAARDGRRAAAYAQEHDIPRVLPDYEAVVSDPDIDIVYIPTPASLHGYWTKRAVAEGKVVLCEKPFAANSEEAQEVATAAAQANVLVMEAMHSLYHPLWTAAKQAIDSGELGKLESIDVDFSWPIADKGDIRWNPNLAGGALMDMGIYPVTLLSYLFGDLTVLSSEAREEDGVDGTLTAQMETSDGVQISFKTSMDADATPAQILEVTGSEGSLTLTGFVHPYDGGKLTVTASGGSQELLADERTSYSFMLEVLRNAVNEGGDIITDAARAVTTMQLIDQLYEAAGLEPRQPTAVSQ